MRRWVKGYTYQKDAEKRPVKPLVKTEFEYDADGVIVSFLDLTELLFIKTFIGYGISVQKIRKAAAAASVLLETTHPFAVRKMFTDGESIFAEIAKEINEPSLLDLLKSQYQFHGMVEPTLTLLECLDFDASDYVERYWPLGKDKDIVLDPSRNMGHPILNKYNVKTGLIYELYKTDHNIDEISDWYELDKKAVEAAIDYESKLVA